MLLFFSYKSADSCNTDNDKQVSVAIPMRKKRRLARDRRRQLPVTNRNKRVRRPPKLFFLHHVRPPRQFARLRLRVRPIPWRQQIVLKHPFRGDRDKSSRCPVTIVQTRCRTRHESACENKSRERAQHMTFAFLLVDNETSHRQHTWRGRLRRHNVVFAEKTKHREK